MPAQRPCKRADLITGHHPYPRRMLHKGCVLLAAWYLLAGLYLERGAAEPQIDGAGVSADLREMLL